jgi:hypothetical protein
LLVALLLSAVFLMGGCTQEEEAGTPEESREEATEKRPWNPRPWRGRSLRRLP